jgi:phenylalanyl-tRNA synthetase beta chain
MQFSENWLRQFVNPAINSETLCHVLTMTGLEVEEIEPVAVAFSKVVVGEVVSAEKHPDADRLQILRVDTGEVEPLQIVSA